MNEAREAIPRVGVPQVLPATNTIAVLCLVGDFDMANAPRIIEEGERVLSCEKDLIVDLSHTTFVDSFAIRALFEVGTKAMTCGRIAVMQLGTVATVECVVELTRLDCVLPRTKTRAEAVDAIEQARARQT